MRQSPWLWLAMLAVWSTAGPAARGADGSDPFAVNQRLGRGVNVMGYDPFWKDQTKAIFKAEHFKLIHDAGFSHVRVGIHPLRDEAPGTQRISDDYLRALDWVLDQALANHLMVVLDLHEFETMSKDPDANKERFLTMWGQIAAHCKDRPDDVLFEILNEPHDKLTPRVWNSFLLGPLAVIRKTNPRRTVVIGPAFWNSIGHLQELELPEDDRHIIVTVHYYDPMTFTHQGAPWVHLEHKTGIPWDGTPAQRQHINDDFDKAAAWSKEHNRPIYLGEFGAYDKADMASRVRYADAVARAAEKRGWSWAWWQFSGDFVLYDIRDSRWVEPLRNALIPAP